ncbi:hypothetical protein ABK040_009358 [Willaertia magna]
MAWLHYKLYRPYALFLIFLIVVNLFLWFYPVIEAGTVFRLCYGYWLFVFLVTIPIFLIFPVGFYSFYAYRYCTIPAIEQAALPGEVRASRTTMEYLKLVGYITLAIVTLLATSACLVLTVIAAVYKTNHISLDLSTVSILEGGRIKGDRISIDRDQDGITHITANVQDDAPFSLGWVHARDRMYQMDFYKRIATGTLSELVGERALISDKFFRSLNLQQVAKNNYNLLSESVKTWMTRYTEGVNYFQSRYLETNKPWESTFYNYKIGSWTNEDSVLILKLWQFLNSGNSNHELIRFYLAIIKQLDIDRVMDLVPTFNNVTGTSTFTPSQLDTPAELINQYIQQEKNTLDNDRNANIYLQTNILNITIKSNTSINYQSPIYSNIDDLLSYFDPATQTIKHSSEWMGTGGFQFFFPQFVVHSSGEAFKSSAPNAAYPLQLRYKPDSNTAIYISCFGQTIPGIPGIFSGRTSIHSWSINAMYADSMDWFVLDEIDSTYYKVGNDIYNYTKQQEIIKIKDKDPITITVRSSQFGPVLSDLLPSDLQFKSGNGKQISMALQWTGAYQSATLEDRTMEWLVEAWTLSFFSDFNQLTLQKWHNPPANILFYSYTSDITTYLGAGRFPNRKSNHAGVFPRFADGNAQWDGFNTALFNFRAFKKINYYVSANNRPIASGYRYSLGFDYGNDFRARRILSLLATLTENGNRLLTSETTINTILNDRVNVFFSEDLKPLLTIAVNGLSSDMRTSSTVQNLLKWDGTFDVKNWEATIAQFWFYELSRIATAETGLFIWDNPTFVKNAFLPNHKYSFRNETEPVSYQTQLRNINACKIALRTIYGTNYNGEDQAACDMYAAKALGHVIDKYGEKRLDSYYKKRFDHYLMSTTNFECACSREIYSTAGSEYSLYQSAPVRPTAKFDETSSSGVDESAKFSTYSNQGSHYQQSTSFASRKYHCTVPFGVTGFVFDKGTYDYYMGPVVDSRGLLGAGLSGEYTTSSSQQLVRVSAVA